MSEKHYCKICCLLCMWMPHLLCCLFILGCSLCVLLMFYLIKKHFEDRIYTMAVITYVANKLISSHYHLCITFFVLTFPENFTIGKVFFCEHVHSSGRDHMMVDLQLSVQSVSLTTKVLSSNSIHGEVYSNNIM